MMQQHSPVMCKEWIPVAKVILDGFLFPLPILPVPMYDPLLNSNTDSLSLSSSDFL